MPTTPDIELRLTLSDYEDPPAEIVLNALQALSDAVYQSEVADLKACRESGLEIPPLVFDLAEQRIKEYRRSSVLVQSVTPGSVVLSVVVSGLAIWVLDKTIGETLKHAWLETDGHRRLKEYLSTRIGRRKAQDIADRAKRKIAAKVPGEVTVQPPSSAQLGDKSRVVIVINVQLRPYKPYPKRRSDELRD